MQLKQAGDDVITSQVTVRQRLVYVVTEDWYFASHRLSVARAAQRAGYEIHVITQLNGSGEALRAEGFVLHPLVFNRASLNPIKQLLLFFRLAFMLGRLQPSIIHNVSLKPVLYSSLAAKLVCRAHVVNTLTGLGFVFSSRSLRARCLRPLASWMLRIALCTRSGVTVFQNVEDASMLQRRGLARASRSALIRGSGVNPDTFAPYQHRGHQGAAVVALPARLLREKGVYEFVAAARVLKARGVSARMVLIGDGDESNPGSVSSAELRDWVGENIVEAWGWRPDMAAALATVDIVVLPAYREGLPKALLEAASCGLPIVTTDTPGCNDVVEDGDNGFLIDLGDVTALADRIELLVGDARLRAVMGAAGRARVLANFTESIINSQFLDVYRQRFTPMSSGPMVSQ